MTNRLTEDTLVFGELRPPVHTPSPIPHRDVNLRSLLVEFRDQPLEKRHEIILRATGARAPEHIEIVRARVQSVLDSFDISRLDLAAPESLKEIMSVVSSLDWRNKSSDEATVSTVLEMYKVDLQDSNTVQAVRALVFRALDRMPQGGA